MKRTILLLMLFVSAFSLSVKAQEKGDMYVGGDLGIEVLSLNVSGVSESTVGVSIEPEFGYFVHDKVKVGAQLSYNLVDGGNIFTVSPSLSYYVRLADKFYYTPQLAIGGGFVAQSGETTGYFAMSLSLFAVEFQPAPNWGFAVDLVNLGYNRIYEVNIVNFNLFSSPSVGIRYYF